MNENEVKAVEAIKNFLAVEVDYTTLMEEAAEAQAQIIEMVSLLSQHSEAYDLDKISTFFYHAIPALQRLRPLSPDGNV